MNKALIFVSLLLLIAFIAGCGETIRGAAKDTNRIGQGIRKVFVSDSTK
ncbi:MAG: hypothetical protein WBD24_03890 [Candidatus Omnitrophota bacterium]|jgi:predicted small secreted protein